MAQAGRETRPGDVRATRVVVVPPHEFQKEEKGSGFRAPGFCTRENLLGVGYRHVMIERRGLGRCLDVVQKSQLLHSQILWMKTMNTKSKRY